MKEFLGEYFELGKAVPVTINTHKNNLKINNIALTQEFFNGAFYSNRMMHIAVEEADCNYNITTTYANGTSTSRSVKSQELDLQVTPDQVAVTIEIITPNGIIEPDNDRCDVIAGDNVITVSGNRPIEQVVLYDTMGRIVAHDLAHGNNSHNIRVTLAGVYIVQVRYTDGNIAQQKVAVK